MYLAQYKWDHDLFPKFSSFLRGLYSRSCHHYLSFDRKTNHELVSCLEYYFASLFSLGFVTEENFSNVFRQIQSLKAFKKMPEDSQQNFYGFMYENDIYVNPKIPSKYGLDFNCMRQMVVSHELGHLINVSWRQEVKDFSEELYSSSKFQNYLEIMGIDDSKYFTYGFDLLDEVISQEVSERVTYRLAGKKRPPKDYYVNPEVFQNKPYSTNYAFYGEFQEFAVSFARCLPFLECSSLEEDAVLERLCKVGFQKDFFSKIKEEMLKDSENLAFYTLLLACMGKIKNAVYHKEEENVKEYFILFRKAIKEYSSFGSVNGFMKKKVL